MRVIIAILGFSIALGLFNITVQMKRIGDLLAAEAARIHHQQADQ